MKMAAILLTQLLAILWPHPLMLAATVVVTLACTFFQASSTRKRHIFLKLGLALFPALLLVHHFEETGTALETPPPASLVQVSQLDNYFKTADLERIVAVLNGAHPRSDNPEVAQLLDQILLPDFVSVTLLNLNLEPLVWKGIAFSDRYWRPADDRPQLQYRDGRLFHTRIFQLPEQSLANGFVVVETLLFSKRADERHQTWFCSLEPENARYLPIVVDTDQAGFLARLAEGLGLDLPPFEIHFVRENAAPLLLDWFSVLWAFLFVGGLISLSSKKRVAPLVYAVCILLPVLPFPARLDFLTTFSSFIFSAPAIGSMLATPFHLLLLISCLFLLARRVPGPSGKFELLYTLVVVLVFLVLLLWVPAWLQENTTFSLTHPLEAFSSPGALLGYISFLLILACSGIMLEGTAPTPHRVKFAVALLVLPLVATLDPLGLITVISFLLLWFFKDLRLPITVRTFMIVLSFYPVMVLREQQAELRYVRDNLLDEITLLVERNHFRMGRIIQRLPSLRDQLEATPHDQLMEMFAKRAGLFEDEIDFSLRLTRATGEVISAIDQHISVDDIVYLGTENRIEVAQESPGSPNWLVFRRTIETSNGSFYFAAVLGNDYQNLSIVRRLRRVDSSDSLRSNSSPSPYFAYYLDVFDLDGNPLYSQGPPNHLGAVERERLLDEPYFWQVQDRSTLFFFKDRSYFYRITHQATPQKMILVRFLALLLVMSLLLNSIRFVSRPGRSFLSRWRRSFSMKLAAFMFLCSVLPTSLLGILLINSIQRNQSREEESLAQSKILAAKNLFRDLSGEDGQAQNHSNGLSARRLPIQKYSRLLGEDLSLFLGGTVVQTNQPEAFRQGVLGRRLPFELTRDLLLGKRAYILDDKPRPDGGNLLVAYSAIRLGPGRNGVLAMTMIPFSQRQKFRWMEQLEFSLTVLLGLLFIMALLTRFFSRSFLEPVSAITRGAARMAKGLDDRPITIQRQDELERMVLAFNTMRSRIRQSSQRLQEQLSTLDETLKSMSSGLLGFSKSGALILENNKVWDWLRTTTPNPTSLTELVAAAPLLEPLTRLFEEAQDGKFSFHLGDGELQQELQATFRLVARDESRDLYAILVVEDITDAVTASRFKAWSEMARRVAHEIKNPLTPIQLEIDLLLRFYKDNHPRFGEALEDAAQQITKQVQDLRRTATEFSDYARPISLEINEANLTVMLEDVLEPYRRSLDNLQIATFLEPNVIAAVDERLLRRSVHNLVVNAVQAMEEEGCLTLRLFRDEQTIQIWIQDTGPGISEEERHRIFEAYFSTKDHGTGLGMVIARKYVDLHEGSLVVDPSYSDGTRFIIRLPLSLSDSI